MADNVIEENVIDKIQVKGKEYYFGIKYDSERNIINDTYFRRDEMPQIEQVVTNAGTAMKGAETCNVELSGSTISVTNRNGETKSVDVINSLNLSLTAF